MNTQNWIKERIKSDQINRYLDNGKDFIDKTEIWQHINSTKNPDPNWIKDILAKSLTIQRLDPKETAALINATDPDLIKQMEQTALKVKLKVYDNRIVTFAPLYISNLCVNNCAYCGFRHENQLSSRKTLTIEEIQKEVEVLAGKIGHKRLIVVYGEHPVSGIDYMVETIKKIYSIRVPTLGKGFGQIRRVNVNAAPMSIEEIKTLINAGLGTYQVFQETYHKETYEKLHPKQTIKGNYLWRLYTMHRAFDAGIDDVGLGVLFGLYDWRFELMALVYHAAELEKKFGIGPHTISFPRLEPAVNTPQNEHSPYQVSDQDFRKLITIIRLSVPYTGMIITARETANIRRQAIDLGITQTDASTKIGVGSYSELDNDQQINRQQFKLGDTRSLDQVIGELAKMGNITSFCTAGYRCGRTGKCIMELLKTGEEGKFCKLNAILTFREWLDDFASPETKKLGEAVIAAELEQVKKNQPQFYPRLIEGYKKITEGERDIFF